MDDVAAIVFLVGLIVLGPWVFVIVMGVRRRRERRESEERLATLTRRVYQVEQKLSGLAQQPAAPAAVAPPMAAAPAAQPRPAAPPPPPVPVTAPPATAAPPSAQPPWPKPAESPYYPRPTTPAPAPAAPAAAPPATPPAQPAAAMRAAAPVAPRVIPPPAFTAPPPPRKKSDFEQLLSENWLVFIGIALLVLGLAFGLSVVWQRLGPAGKDFLGLVSALAILGGGVWLEKKPRYIVFARAGIGGGWAALFFMTYALYHVPATQVITSQALDLGLLFIVALVMVLHTLKYDSQAVTGVAFLLAFSTVTISRVNVYSLGASAILALGLVVIVTRKRWFELEVFGILASYLNHWWWLHPIIESMGGNKRMFPEFFPSAGILVVYWAAYRCSYVFRDIEHDHEERVSSVAAILNTALLLFVLKYQSVTPKYAFYALLVIGAAEIVFGLMTRARDRRIAFVVLSTMGATLFVAAFPFKFSGGELSILWLVVAEMFYLAGVFNDEPLFRRFGRLAELVVTAQLFYSHPLDAPKSWENATVFLFAAVLFGANSHLVPWRWPKIFDTRLEQFGARLISWLGVGMAMTAIWLAFPQVWNAVGWAMLALWLALAGYTLAQKELCYQANVVAILATVSALALNLDDTHLWHGMTMRLITVSMVAALLYLTARFSWPAKLAAPGGFQLRPIYTWAAALLVALLSFDEIAEPWVAAVWVLFALLLAFLGRRQKMRDLGLQAHVLAVLAFFFALFINTSHGEPWHLGMNVRLAGTLVVLAALYVLAQWSELDGWPWTRGLGTLHAWAASFLVAWLMWYELLPVSVAVAWAVFGVGLLEFGLARPASDKYWRAQAYIVLGAAFLRIFFVNLNAAGQPGEISPRVYTTLPIALLLYYAYTRLETVGLEAKDLTRRGATLFSWMGMITVVALVRFELPADWVAAAWAALVGVLVAVAWRTGRASFTAQGLLLTVAVAFRAAMHNFYERSYFAHPTWAQRWLPVGVAVALLFAALAPAFKVRNLKPSDAEKARHPLLGGLLRRPEQPIFFAAVALLTVLLYFEVDHTLVTVAWGVEAVALFIFAMLVRETSFRRTGLAVLMIGIGKIVIFDVWSFTRGEIALTFIIAAFCALGIGFLATRYRESLKEYL